MAENSVIVKLMQKLKDDEERLKKDSAMIAASYGYNKELQQALKILLLEAEVAENKAIEDAKAAEEAKIAEAKIAEAKAKESQAVEVKLPEAPVQPPAKTFRTPPRIKRRAQKPRMS